MLTPHSQPGDTEQERAEGERTSVVYVVRSQSHSKHQQGRLGPTSYFNAYFPEGSYLHIIYF